MSINTFVRHSMCGSMYDFFLIKKIAWCMYSDLHQNKNKMFAEKEMSRSGEKKNLTHKLDIF